ncbi:MAG: polysaccharide biosynthesis/export family protein, partial [Planctomycetota bacterium]
MMQKGLIFSLSVLLVFSLAGCNNDILDPTQLGRFEPTPTVNVILNTLGVADEPSPTYEGAEDPKPEDLIDYEQDYTFGAGDVVRISIFELYQEFVNYVNDYVITETGRVSIPDVGVVRAAGLTEAELEREIVNILSPNIIKNPSVTVTSINSQSRIFSVIGQGVGQAGRFTIPRYTYRLTDAIADAGNIGDFNVSYIYVSRDVPAPSVDTDTGA